MLNFCTLKLLTAVNNFQIWIKYTFFNNMLRHIFLTVLCKKSFEPLKLKRFR